MKAALLVTLLLVSAQTSRASEIVQFKTVKKPDVGESTGFEVPVNSKAILKAPNGSHVIIEFVAASHKEHAKTLEESCRIVWISITKTAATTHAEGFKIVYSVQETEDGERSLKQIDGTEDFSIGGLQLRWSYGSDKMIYLYPKPGVQFAVTTAK